MEKSYLATKEFYARPYHDVNSPFGVDDRGAFAEYIIHDPNNMPSLALGATALIRDRRENQDLWIACRITGLKIISPFNPERQSLLYQQDNEYNPRLVLDDLNGPHVHQPMLIRVELLRELVKGDSDNFVISAIQRPPTGKSVLIFPKVKRDDSKDGEPTLEDILNIRSNGLDLGMIGFGNLPYETNSQFLTYRWDIEALDNKHVFIVGESGSGKTVLLKNLAYQIRKFNKNNRVILTDVQGDISQLLIWDLVNEKGESNILKPIQNWQKKVAQEPYEKVQKYFEPFQLVIPKIKGQDLDEDIIRLKRLANNRKNVKVKEIGLRLQDLSYPSDVEYLFRITSEQAPGLLDDIAESLKNREEKVSIERLDLALNRLLSNNQGSTITLTTNGLSYYRSTFEAARRGLNNLKKYFDIDSESVKSEKNPLDVFLSEGTTILYLDHLNQEERLMWEMQLVKWLYENKKEMNNTYVFFDEAHQIIPAEDNSFGSKAVFNRLRANFERLAREGRKFRINLILSTQNPKDLHEIVPEQCPTRIVMKINPKNAKYAFLDEGLGHIANSFGQGQFWIQSPFNGTPDWIRVHSMPPPVPHETMESFRKNLELKAKSEK